MPVNLVESKRAQLIDALQEEKQIVVASGIWEAYNGTDILELYAGLKDPGDDLRNRDYRTLASRLNGIIRQIQAACGEPTGNFSWCFNYSEVKPNSLHAEVLSAGRLGYRQETVNERPALSEEQEQLLAEWQVIRYEPAKGNNATPPIVQRTEVIMYPHPLIAELQAYLYDQVRTRQTGTTDFMNRGDYWHTSPGERLRQAKSGYRSSDWGATREVLEVAATQPYLLPNLLGLADKYRFGLRFDPLSIYNLKRRFGPTPAQSL